MECPQAVGDMVYVPGGWLHLTLNDGEVVGLGAQAGVRSIDQSALQLGVEAGEHSALLIIAQSLFERQITRAQELLVTAAAWHPHEFPAHFSLIETLIAQSLWNEASDQVELVEATLLRLGAQAKAHGPGIPHPIVGTFMVCSD